MGLGEGAIECKEVVKDERAVLRPMVEAVGGRARRPDNEV